MERDSIWLSFSVRCWRCLTVPAVTICWDFPFRSVQFLLLFPLKKKHTTQQCWIQPIRWGPDQRSCFLATDSCFPHLNRPLHIVCVATMRRETAGALTQQRQPLWWRGTKPRVLQTQQQSSENCHCEEGQTRLVWQRGRRRGRGKGSPSLCQPEKVSQAQCLAAHQCIASLQKSWQIFAVLWHKPMHDMLKAAASIVVQIVMQINGAPGTSITWHQRHVDLPRPDIKAEVTCSKWHPSFSHFSAPEKDSNQEDFVFFLQPRNTLTTKSTRLTLFQKLKK